MRAIQLARGVLSAHMFAERIRATATFLSGASAHFENLIIMLGFGPKGFYEDLTSSVRFHRILRRGREYGSELLPPKKRCSQRRLTSRLADYISFVSMPIFRASSSSCKMHG